MKKEATVKIYGMVARYATPEALVKAADRMRVAGYTRLDALTPFPVHGLAQALGLRKSPLAALTLLGGVAGAVLGAGLQIWASSIQYPHVVSGRPLISWPSFVPIVFCCIILSSAFTAFLGMLLLNNLPRPYHPIFSAPGVEDATTSKFVLIVEASDPQFDPDAIRNLLKGTGAEMVEEAPLESSDELLAES